jgi:pimeloyl-ACP methyl ester carboxylesterase
MASAQGREITLEVEGYQLEGTLSIPLKAEGLVLLAHGSGSSRYSPRNQYVASVLGGAGLGTLLFDLLTKAEAAEDELANHLRFDIDFLATRLVGATDWVLQTQAMQSLGLGYFGASTGAAAALVAAVQRPDAISAIVSRGGRPDLAAPYLARVRAPTLLIVGGRDSPVIEMNKEAFAKLAVAKDLRIVPGATHLFEERGALEEVARLAAEWFVRYL